MFKIRKIKAAYYSHNYDELLNILKEIGVLQRYTNNMLELDTSSESLRHQDNKEVSPSSLMVMSFNFSESKEGVEFWKDIVQEIKVKQTTKVI